MKYKMSTAQGYPNEQLIDTLKLHWYNQLI